MLLESFDTGAGCRTQINERYHASNPVCKPARTTANIVINKIHLTLTKTVTFGFKKDDFG